MLSQRNVCLWISLLYLELCVRSSCPCSICCFVIRHLLLVYVKKAKFRLFRASLLWFYHWADLKIEGCRTCRTAPASKIHITDIYDKNAAAVWSSAIVGGIPARHDFLSCVMYFTLNCTSLMQVVESPVCPALSTFPLDLKTKGINSYTISCLPQTTSAVFIN